MCRRPPLPALPRVVESVRPPWARLPAAAAPPLTEEAELIGFYKMWCFDIYCTNPIACLATTVIIIVKVCRTEIDAVLSLLLLQSSFIRSLMEESETCRSLMICKTWKFEKGLAYVRYRFLLLLVEKRKGLHGHSHGRAIAHRVNNACLTMDFYKVNFFTVSLVYLLIYCTCIIEFCHYFLFHKL